MEIRKLFSRREENNSVNSNQSNASGVSSKDVIKEIELENKEASETGSDVVRLSDLSRQLFQISEIVDEEQVSRSQRISELKQAIANGSYSVSSEEVARSILSYVQDEDVRKDN